MELQRSGLEVEKTVDYDQLRAEAEQRYEDQMMEKLESFASKGEEAGSDLDRLKELRSQLAKDLVSRDSELAGIDQQEALSYGVEAEMDC